MYIFVVIYDKMVHEHKYAAMKWNKKSEGELYVESSDNGF